ncbi:MAG: ATP-grasp domain-containing protein [Thermodesulforhabdaceae bacterium]|jgi:ribosomal protein S6--L-glutamate ligase
MRKVSMGKHLRYCRSVPCVGVRLNWNDYSPDVQNLIKTSDVIYYPSRLYEQFFKALGKKVFPENCCEFIGNKIRQTLLFEWLSIPHPRTGIYYGKGRFARIMKDFKFPFVAKDPVGSSQGKGVFLISSEDDLRKYLERYRPAYIQEYFPVEKDLRVIIFASRAVHAYWRTGRPGDFRHNVSRGASISFENIPEEALKFAEDVSKRCGFHDVGMDIIDYEGSFYVVEVNMVYGKKGLIQANKHMNTIIAVAETEGWL